MSEETEVPTVSTATIKHNCLCDVVCCARCSRDHLGLAFLMFKNPPPNHTHWATCPETDEPILMRIEGVGHNAKPLGIVESVHFVPEPTMGQPKRIRFGQAIKPPGLTGQLIKDSDTGDGKGP